MRIAVSAKHLDMPHVCVCCGGTSSTTMRVSATRMHGKRVVRTKTSTWEFPSCARCTEHDREWPTASLGAVFVLTMLTCGLYLYFYVKRRQRALSLCSSACARPHQAVAYLGWHGTVHQFEVASTGFARAFMTSNAKKIVDADSRARELMQTPAAPPPPAAALPPTPRQTLTPRAERVGTPPMQPPAPSRAAASSRDGFYGPNHSITVAGRTLHGPLAYVMSNGTNADASSIITSLRVGNRFGAEPLSYWPTYAEASPSQRAVYLDWHVSGRCDPEIPIGYVFIHFYGLERRVLVDECDHEIVQAELKRLLGIYGGLSRSFRGYATGLLAFMALPALPSLSEYACHSLFGEIAEDNAVARAGLLAWFYLHRRPLPASCAMLVAASMEDAKRGTVVKRARAELDDLFAIRYRERFGDGIMLEASSRNELIPYHAGSPSLLTAARQIQVSIPQVVRWPAQFTPLVNLWNECVADLKKLSFARRDNADAPLSAEAWMALPPELRAECDHPDQEKWDEAVRAAPHVEGLRILPAGRLAALAGIDVDERVTGARLRKAVEVAAALGYVVEPDARISAKTVPVTSEVAIWRAHSTEPPDATLWKSVHTMLSLTLSVALSDGDVAHEEGRAVDGLIEDLFALDDSMRTRVAALRTLLTRQPTRATAVAKKLKDARSAAELAKIGRVLVAVAAVDGVIVEGEHRSLKSLYKAMGLSASELSAAIIASGARLETDKTIQAREARPSPNGEAIPPPPDERSPKLNAPAIAAILAETREVALLLSEVLDEDEDEPRAVSKALPATASKPTGNGAWQTLDARYHDVLRELLTRPVWTVAEVRLLAQKAKVMPGAIVEVVNAWSEERFGDYVIEEAGDWRIHASLVEKS